MAHACVHTCTNVCMYVELQYPKGTPFRALLSLFIMYCSVRNIFNI